MPVVAVAVAARLMVDAQVRYHGKAPGLVWVEGMVRWGAQSPMAGCQQADGVPTVVHSTQRLKGQRKEEQEEEGEWIVLSTAGVEQRVVLVEHGLMASVVT